MNIKHDPLIEVDKVEQHYTEKDETPVKYVVTSSLKNDTVPVDIFYRDTPHPEFGNKYFGIYYDFLGKHYMICNADYIEELDFQFAEDAEGNLHYSQHRHDFHSINGESAIDGGRSYTRCVGTVKLTDTYTIVDGNFRKKN
jgi:hypothetical protein